MAMVSILRDEYISDIKKGVSSHKQGINHLSFKYTAHEKILLIDSYGIENVPSNEAYFDNIEDHLMYANLTWLSPFIHHLNKKINVNLKAEVIVSPDGSMQHDNINLTVSAVIHKHNYEKSRALHFSNVLFTALIPFRDYITLVEFKGNKHYLTQIIFTLNLDGKKVNSILANRKVVNQQILSQWLQTVDNIIDYTKGRYKFSIDVPVINGKMVPSSFRSAISFRFKISGDENEE